MANKNTISIISEVARQAARSGELIMAYLARRGIASQAQPYIAIATIGAQYLSEIVVMLTAGNEDPANALRKSPADLWAGNEQWEQSIELLKALQLERLKEKVVR